ncbi:L-rhamnose mutarotase [Celerinatantimonas sp. MCCC 1A17872]|uniref:L-rhamnose mutarotase n=1 Tax=Celerinatantimonas sp. MCCC 1A17872 TaxID=3177514 RepID=UPI0038C249B4
MIRKATIMSVDPECAQEYQRRHEQIWPEMVQELKAHGAHNYSIFLDAPTGRLFAYVEIEDEKRWAAMAQTEVCQRWWKMMCDIMPSNADNSPIEKPLKEVFYLK